jgi:hypothetical protein
MLPRVRPRALSATRGLSLAVVVLLAGNAVLAWMALHGTFVFVELTWWAVAARHDYRALLIAHLDQFQVLRDVQLGLWLVTTATFVLWAGRANANLSRLGAAGLRYAPREAMTAFLVPGVNLVRPVTVLREIWNVSDALARSITPSCTAPAPLRVRWWWGLVVSTLAVEAIGAGLALRSGQALDLGPAMQALVVGQLLGGAAAIVAIAVVLGIDSRQSTAAWRGASALPAA